MSTVLNVKIDPILKKQAQEVARSLGLPVSTVVAAGLRDFVRTRSITISDAPKLKPEIEVKLIRASKLAKKGKDISPTFTDLTDAFTWLDSENDD